MSGELADASSEAACFFEFAVFAVVDAAGPEHAGLSCSESQCYCNSTLLGSYTETNLRQIC